MAVIDGIGLQEPSTITKNLAAVPITRNSSVTYQECMVLASPNSTTLLALAEVMGSIPQSTVVGLAVRPVQHSLVTVNSTAGTSTIASLVSSQATTVPYVTAFTATSTAAGPLVCGFYAGTTLKWPVTLWASGGEVNVSQSVSPPGYLFAGSTGEALSFNLGSTGHVRVAVTYWVGA